MEDVCLKVCGESFDEIRGKRNSKADKADKNKTLTNIGKSKTGVVGITKKIQSVEDFENENEDTKTETVNKKAEAENNKSENKNENKSETKPKQEVEIHDDAYYEELFNSVEF